MRICNMEAVTIVEILNKKFELMNCVKGVHFILQKLTKNNNSFKAYKEYNYKLWYLYNGQKHIIIDIKHTAREVSDSEKAENIKYMDEQLLLRIFSLFTDNININPMLKGEFQGYGIIDKNE